MRALEGQLRERIWEEGFALAPVGRAALDVDVTMGRNIEIHVRGSESESLRLRGVPEDVRNLEVFHAVMEMVESAKPRRVNPNTEFFRVEIVGSEEVPYPALRRMVHDAIVRGGAVVSRRGGPSDSTLCVWPKGGYLYAQAIALGNSCDPSPTVFAGIEAGWSTEEPVRSTVDRLVVPLLAGPVRSAATTANPFVVASRPPPPPGTRIPERDAEPAQSAPPPPRTRSDPSPTAAVRRRTETDSPPRNIIALAARAGFAARSGGLDPLIGLSLRGGRSQGLRALVSLEVMPSSAIIPGVEAPGVAGVQLNVQDWVVAGGPSFGRYFAPNLAMEIGAIAGPQIHHYSTGPLRNDLRLRGNRADLMVSVPLTLWVKVVRDLSFDVGVVASVSTRSQAHAIDQEVFWSRGVFRFGLTIGLNYDWRLG